MEYSFPSNWNEVYQENNTFVFTSFDSTNDTRILIILHSISSASKQDILLQLKRNLEQQVQDESKNILETGVHVIPFSDSGYYFTATDKNWSESDVGHDWPYMLRSIYVTDSLAVELTVLCYDQSSATIQEAFEWMKKISTK
jgi:hypothetical protein